MSAEKLPPKTLPEWTKVLAPDSCLRTSDILAIWGCCPTTMARMMTDGRMPRPDIPGRGGDRGWTRSLWRAKTVRRFIRRWWKEHGEAK